MFVLQATEIKSIWVVLLIHVMLAHLTHPKVPPENLRASGCAYQAEAGVRTSRRALRRAANSQVAAA